MPHRESSPGIQLSTLAAKGAGLAVTSNPFGAALSATVGTFFVPGVATGTAKASVAAAVFTGSWALAWVAIPIIGGIFAYSFVLPPEIGAKYRTLALILGFANLIICAGIAAAALSAAGASVSFAATTTCVLAGAGAVMLSASVLAGLTATCLCQGFGDFVTQGTNGGGSDFGSQLWSGGRR